MVTVLTPIQGSQLGSETRKLRIALNISQKALSEKTGVSVTSIDHFEHNLPVALVFRRSIIRELWAIKAGNGAPGTISRL
jgi:transcriptional regulator with XRE-family HTH domain